MWLQGLWSVGLLLGRVTVCGQVNHLSIYTLTNIKVNSAFCSSGVGKSSTGLLGCMGNGGARSTVSGDKTGDIESNASALRIILVLNTLCRTLSNAAHTVYLVSDVI